MESSASPDRTGLLVSGGLDSGILLGHFLERGRTVQPFYVRSGLFWEDVELAALRSLLERLAGPRLMPLVVFDMPMADVYRNHWSVTGRSVPDAEERSDCREGHQSPR